MSFLVTISRTSLSVSDSVPGVTGFLFFLCSLFDLFGSTLTSNYKSRRRTRGLDEECLFLGLSTRHSGFSPFSLNELGWKTSFPAIAFSG